MAVIQIITVEMSNTITTILTAAAAWNCLKHTIIQKLCNYCLQVQETISRGRAPNLRNYASQYRDADPQLVWRATCLFVAAMPNARAANNNNEVDMLALMQDFKTGVLDAALMDKARAMDASLDLDDISYIRRKVHGTMASWSPGQLELQLGQAEQQKIFAEFDLFAAELTGEQLQFSQYSSRKGAREDEALSTVTKLREDADAAKESCMQAHMSPHFAVEALPDRTGVRAYMQAAGRAFCNAPPRKAEEQTLHLHVMSMPGMGVHHSLYLGDMVSHAADFCTNHPRNSGVLVLMGNTPAWGKGLKVGKPGWEEAVEEAQRDCLSAFEACPDLKVRKVMAKYDKSQMYSVDRELVVEFLMVTSKAQDADGQWLAAYSRSPVWRLRAFPIDLVPNPRSAFQHYTDALLRREHGNLDNSVELRQWHSGAEFWDQILCAIHEGPLGSDDLSCMVHEYLMYDPELGKAVINLRARGSKKQPVYGYAGVQVRDYLAANSGKNIADNVKTALVNHLSFAVDCGTYKLPGYNRPVISSSGVLEAAAPEPTLVHTVVRGKDLPLKQTVHDKWDKMISAKERWDVLVKTHNAKYNKGGVPWKASRPAPEPLVAMEEGQAVTLGNAAGAPANREALMATLNQAGNTQQTLQFVFLVDLI